MRGQLQTQRYERKYLLTETQAVQAREFMRRYLVPDEHSEGKANFSYPVHSLYLDSDNLTTYWDQVHGAANRFKLRLRYYDEDISSPVFFEVKRRANECIVKERSAVPKSAAPVLVAGHFPSRHYLLKPYPSQFVALQNFWRIMNHLSARPKVHVSYWREAWVHPENNTLRATFDRDVRGEALRSVRLTPQMTEPSRPFGRSVVLELKYTHSFPDWYRDLVWHFSLVQVGVPKYCGCVETIGVERVATSANWKQASPRGPIRKSSYNHSPRNLIKVESAPTGPMR